MEKYRETIEKLRGKVSQKEGKTKKKQGSTVKASYFIRKNGETRCKESVYIRKKSSKKSGRSAKNLRKSSGRSISHYTRSKKKLSFAIGSVQKVSEKRGKTKKNEGSTAKTSYFIGKSGGKQCGIEAKIAQKGRVNSRKKGVKREKPRIHSQNELFYREK